MRSFIIHVYEAQNLVYTAILKSNVRKQFQLSTFFEPGGFSPVFILK